MVPTGLGVLILFVFMHIGMLAWAVFKGDQPSWLEWVGMAIAFAALVYLVSPGLMAPAGLVLIAIGLVRLRPTWQGVALGLVSGAITSGLGYIIWYRALLHLTRSRAALVQLTVPAIAAVVAKASRHAPRNMKYTAPIRHSPAQR